jgi:solute:Na+ symporter, SSS family
LILNWFDYFILAGIFSVLFGAFYYSKNFTKSVADFLVAGRTGGRYLVSLSSEAAGIGAITVIGNFEMNYIAGFNMQWWSLSTAVVIMLMTISGWVLYRFRKTRCFTMAQFFEERYSKKFRIFAGFLAYVSGILNFGIFPSVTALFFVYFCGFPEYIHILGFSVSTYILTVFSVIFIPLLLVIKGGQISIMITDFFQGLIVNIVLVIIIVFFLLQFNWSQIYVAAASAPVNASIVNPFKTSAVKDFNFWYFVIGIVGILYTKLSWQGSQAYNASSKTAHEAKMGDVLCNWRTIIYTSALLFIPIIAYTVMHNPEFAGFKANVDTTVGNIDNNALKSQLIVPLVLQQTLPHGLIGAFIAIMFAASITCHAPYLHSWGAILIQDVIIPLRGKPFEQKQHLFYLKLSIFGVAVFIFFFSILFKQIEYIFMFFSITAAIFVGGSGAVIIGGLYWKRGTTTAAWSAMITGAVIAVGGMILQQLVPNLPMNGQMFWATAMAMSIIVYIVVSLMGKPPKINMDKILNRGKYEIEGEVEIINEVTSKRWKFFGMGKEFTKSDKIIFILTYIYTLGWGIVFIIGTVLALTQDISNASWLYFWKIFIWINAAISLIVTVWFSIGGVKNLKEMTRKLGSMKRDSSDSGYVEHEKYSSNGNVNNETKQTE